MRSDDSIRVSELAEFVYCQRAWWLKMVKKAPSSAASRETQSEGELWHKEQGEHIARTDALSGAAYAAFGIGILLLLLAAWNYLR